MKELLNNADYKSLNEKLNVKGKSKSPEDLLIEGITFEFGLGKKIDRENAEGCYRSSFQKNNLMLIYVYPFFLNLLKCLIKSSPYISCLREICGLTNS